MRLNLKGYAARPEPQKTERNITKMKFYNPDDSVIQLARWVQNGRSIKGIDILLDEMADQSIYAQSMAMGIVSLQKADKILTSA
jgi:hypothetical protein